MKAVKTTIFALVLALIFCVLSACSGESNDKSGTFPSVNSADIPDGLEMAVGTLGDTYFTSFDASDNDDYQAYLSATYENTTDTDYAVLMEHYQTDSTGMDEDGILLFDWGWLNVTQNNDSISIDAYIRR